MLLNVFQGRIACANVLSDLYAMGITECDNMLMLLSLSQKMNEKVNFAPPHCPSLSLAKSYPAMCCCCRCRKGLVGTGVASEHSVITLLI